MISNEGTRRDEFTITPSNPPASDQKPALVPGGADSIQRSMIQQIPSIEKQSQLGFFFRLPLPSLALENK
ncbi:MAG TPA: hypothetical protein VF222_10190 [Nitrososphaeraceae archaeon]